MQKIISHDICISLDSAYAERYMGLPNASGSYKGYEEADVNLRVEKLRDKMFYLVHGTADDNVHFQQSMTLAKNLANKGVLFRQQVNIILQYSRNQSLFNMFVLVQNKEGNENLEFMM
jgi:hypothetical protein